MDTLELLTGQRRADPTPQFPLVYDALVVRVSDAGAFFELKEMLGYEFGPAPYPRIHVSGSFDTASGGAPGHTHAIDILVPDDPPAGTACVVAFAEGDPDKPRVLCFYGWPA